jgi:hypothetical protein
VEGLDEADGVPVDHSATRGSSRIREAGRMVGMPSVDGIRHAQLVVEPGVEEQLQLEGGGPVLQKRCHNFFLIFSLYL